MFASLPPADTLTTFLEERHVEGHLLAINGLEDAAPIDVSLGDLASERVVAARGCAKTLGEGACERYIGLVVHSGNKMAKVFIMERDEYEGQ